MPPVSNSKPQCYVLIEPAKASVIPCRVCGQTIQAGEPRVRYQRTRSSPQCIHSRCVPNADGLLGRCNRADFLAVAAGVPDQVVSDVEDALMKFNTLMSQLTLRLMLAPPHTRLPENAHVLENHQASANSSSRSAPYAVTGASPAQQQPNDRRLSSAQFDEIMRILPSHYAFPGSMDALSECVICLEPLGETRALVRLPCMCHFHKSCIAEWLHKKPCCPTDLTDVSLILRGQVQDLT